MAFNDRNMYRNVATHGDTAVCLEGLVEGIEDRLRLWCERGQARRRSRRLGGRRGERRGEEREREKERRREEEEEGEEKRGEEEKKPGLTQD